MPPQITIIRIRKAKESARWRPMLSRPKTELVGACLIHPANPVDFTELVIQSLLQLWWSNAPVEPAAGRAPEGFPALRSFGTRFRIGGPGLKPVIRSNSCSNDAAASGALLWP